MGKEDYDFDDNLFYGFTLKDLLKFAIPAVVGTFTKNIISDFIESITSTTQIIINLSGTVILVAVLLPILMYLIIKRNTRVRVKKEEEKLKKINDDNERKLIELKEKHESELKKYEIYPSETINYNYTFECSRQDLIFHNRNEIDYIRTNTLKGIDCNELQFHYAWTGSNIKSIYLDDPEHKYEITLPKKELTLMNKEISKNVISESNDYEYPIVGDYSIVPSNGNFESTAQTKVVFELTNCNNTMHTFLSLNVQRPITQLILCVTFPENLKVKNIVIKKKLLFGDYKDEKLSAQNYTMTKKNHGNTHSLKKVSYKIVINQPKMFYCYSINWEWK